MEDLLRRQIRCNAFWYFKFSANAEDGRRAAFLKKIISIFERISNCLTVTQLLDHYHKLYRKNLNIEMFNELFGTDETSIYEIFKYCSPIFYVKENFINYQYYGDDLFEYVDIFKDEKDRLNIKYGNINIFGDKIFNLLKSNENSMDVLKIMSDLNISGIDAKTFIGYLIMHFSESFDVKFQHAAVFITLKCNNWPSSLYNSATCIFDTFSYPSIIKLRFDKNPFPYDVKLAYSNIPNDGIFVQFSELENLKKYIEDELVSLYHIHYNHINKLKLARLYKYAPCILLDKNERFVRAQITDQTGDGRVMVECVDEQKIVFVTRNYLFNIPEYLLGIPICGVYGVLTFAEDNRVKLMHLAAMRSEWEKIFKMIKFESNMFIKAYFIDKASDNEYSGFRKSIVYKIQLVFQNDSGIWTLPEYWC